MRESEKRLHRCCFTGHRPEKLPQSEKEIKLSLEKAIIQAIDDGFTVFISGMARGVDIWASEIVLSLKSYIPNVRLICAIPYAGFEKNWSHEWKKRYFNILANADLIRYINPHYDRSCFQKRNEWMVNHAARVIAVFYGLPGGTKNTIEYAKSNNIDIKQIP